MEIYRDIHTSQYLLRYLPTHRSSLSCSRAVSTYVDVCIGTLCELKPASKLTAPIPHHPTVVL